MRRRRRKMIEPPEHLDAQAQAEWRRLVPQLQKTKKVTEADLALLEGYATSYARWKHAEAELAKTGPVVRSPQGGAQQTPWLAVARAALRDMHAALDALALTPKRRQKAAADEDQDDGDHLALLDFG